ncbi:MAG: hypothetical protein M1828_004489 [Chrysothrix sp. TS-e1954]|nr:MAG: hypothetical protein M1828_004489 [Chrysothrix sp. TS-e1954]
MDAYTTYHALTSIYLSLQSLPLLLAPRLSITLLQTQVRDTTSTETFLSRALALSLLALALLSLVLSGIVPLGRPASSSSSSEDEGEGSGAAPFATPTTLVTVLYHVSTLVLSYVRFSNEGQAVYALGAAGSGTLAAVGLWCLVFGGGAGRTHRSGFMFPDKERRERKVGRREERWAKKGL